jgi:hypothetical protein
MIFYRVSNPERHSVSSSIFTHDPSHSKPHANPPPQFLADEKRQNAPGEGSQVVYRHDDALEGAGWVSEGVAPVFVAYDA